MTPRCVCDGRYDGCDHPNPCGQPDDGTDRGPWCAQCNPRRLDAVTHNGLAGWYCTTCVTVHIDAALDDEDGEVHQRDLTLAELVTSAEEHERERHNG